MDPEALEPFGRALIAFFDGDSDAVLLLRRDDGFEAALPVRHFFRDPDEFSPIENRALEECGDGVFDIGAGTGLHSLYLQAKGHTVKAIDICPQAVAIMRRRGVRNVQETDVFAMRCEDTGEQPFDTLLMLGHAVGAVGDLDGLGRFLGHARDLLEDEGRLLLDSLDVQRTDHPEHLAYHEKNRLAGRYVGRTRLQFEFAGFAGPWCEWLHVDPKTLAEVATRAGWQSEVLLQQDAGDYLARLAPDGRRS